MMNVCYRTKRTIQSSEERIMAEESELFADTVVS